MKIATRTNSLLILVTLCLLLCTSDGWAQTVEITPFGGVRFGGSINVAPPAVLPIPNAPILDQVKLKTGPNFGIMFDYTISERGQFEFMWNRQVTDLLGRTANTGVEVNLSDAKVDNYQFGFVYRFMDWDSNLRPFFVAGLGFTNLRTKLDSRSRTYFALGFGGGVKYALGRYVGVRAEGRYIPSKIGTTSQFFCTQLGCAAVTEDHYLHQIQLNGGIIFRF